MFRPTPHQRLLQSPTPAQRAARRFAASKMTGATRRSFEAERTLKDCGGEARQGDSVCGWGRQTVERGRAARRTGLLCLGAPCACRGRTRWEDAPPPVAAVWGQLAAAQAQPAPTFRTSWASTRLPAHAALEALRAQGYDAAPLPAPSPMAQGLHRRGCRFRHVVKAQPPKQSKETDAIFAHLQTRGPRARLGPGPTLAHRWSRTGASWRPRARWSPPRPPPSLCACPGGQGAGQPGWEGGGR